MPRPVDFDPFAEEPTAVPPAEPGWMDWIKSGFTGEGRTQYPDAPEFGAVYEDSLPKSAVPAMQKLTVGGTAEDEAFADQIAAREWKAGRQAVSQSAITPDPAAQIDILRKAIPGLEVQPDKFGNVMLKTPNMKDFTYLNKPGISSRDWEEFGTQTAATAPILGWGGGMNILARPALNRAAAVTAASNSLPGLMMRGGAAGVGASVAQDVGAMAAGSEQGVDPGRAVIQGVIGGAAPAVVSGVGAVAGGVGAVADATGDFFRTAFRPAAQARREVQGAFATDARVGGLNPVGGAQDRINAANRGQDLRVMDFGGETTRALARKSANISPAARDMLMRVITPRGAKMATGRRGQDLIENEFGLARSTELARQDLRQQALNARTPLYRQANQQGAAGLDSPILQQLQTSPIFQRAMAAAERRVQDQAATPGWVSTGVRGHNSGHYTLEFWDQTKRVLDDYAREARRAGRDHEGALLESMARSLRNDLDQAVPIYQQARGTAATFFGQDDALEAGAEFARGGRYNLDDARRAFQALNPAERNLFQEGFADVLVQRIRQNPRYLNQLRDLPAEFDRVQLALGPQRFAELEGFMRIEQIMQRAKDAMGNSTTARQLRELDQKFGGNIWNWIGGGATGSGLATMSPTAMLTGFLIMGGKKAHDALDRRVAEQVARLLTSSDPDVFLRGIQQAGRSPIIEAIRAFDHMLTDAGIPQLTPLAVQTGVNANSYEPEERR